MHARENFAILKQIWSFLVADRPLARNAFHIRVLNYGTIFFYFVLFFFKLCMLFLICIYLHGPLKMNLLTDVATVLKKVEIKIKSIMD